MNSTVLLKDAFEKAKSLGHSMGPSKDKGDNVAVAECKNKGCECMIIVDTSHAYPHIVGSGMVNVCADYRKLAFEDETNRCISTMGINDTAENTLSSVYKIIT